MTLKDVLSKLESPAWPQPNDKSVSNIKLLKKKDFELNFIITTDLEGAEEKFNKTYGQGLTYYFSPSDYESGKRVIIELFQYLRLKRPRKFFDPELLYVGKPLFLFCHVIPASIASRAEIWLVEECAVL